VNFSGIQIGKIQLADDFHALDAVAGLVGCGVGAGCTGTKQ
jgi:hypothetical protein